MENEFQVQNIALKTLKQRCEYLQQRLDTLEEENCKLKLEKAQKFNNSNSRTSSNDSCLEEEVIMLKKENSRMAHQIQMITTENFNLWSQLSKVLPASGVTSESLAFSPVPNGLQGYKFNQSESAINMNFSSNNMGDFNKESLEEISLKLINGILMGKNELENQYSQMIDLQRENNTEEMNLILPKQFDNRALTKNIRDYVQKLKDFKQILFQQKNDLSNAITVMKNFENTFGQNNVYNKDLIHTNNSHYSNENEIKLNESESEYLTLQGGEQSNADMICPLCSENFTITTYDNFYKHVVKHFDDENDEFVDAQG